MFLVVAAVTAYLVLRRDRLLGELQKINLELTHMSSELQNKNTVLQNAMDEIKTLKGILPICSYCKKIRDDKGYWNRLESYLHAHSEVEFSHGICPDCAKKLYPDYFNEE
jgi:Zn finger protein HypA/HybF involved in hydrogenase expression